MWKSPYSSVAILAQKPFSLEHSVLVDTGCGEFVVVSVCVCTCRESGDCLVLVLSLLHWLSTGVSNARGSRVKNVQKESWRVRSQLMGERSGPANSAQSRMCGRDGVAGAATMTFQQGCVGSTGRRSPQGPETGLRALRRRAGRKTESPKNWRQKTRIFGQH